VLQVGVADTAEYVQVLAISAQRVSVTPPLQQDHEAGERVVRIRPSGSGTTFLRWLARWLGLELRPAHGERWNRELVRLAGRIWPWRGTPSGAEAFVNAFLRNEAQATLCDPANPLQIGLVSTVGVDTVICGSPPHYFWVDLRTETGNSRLYHPEGLNEMIQAVHQALYCERPAHTYYDLRLQAHTMQIGSNATIDVGARVGDTTLLWDAPLVIPGIR
jgi:phage tail-like protein